MNGDFDRNLGHDFVFGSFITVIALLVLTILLPGCAALNTFVGGTDATLETNKLIAVSNIDGKIQAGNAFAACNGEPGCLVGVAFVYGSNIGQQAFFRPRDGVDYLQALVPYGDMFLRMYGMSTGGGSGSGRGAIIINRSPGASVSGIGNTFSNTGSGSIAATFENKSEMNPIAYSFNPVNSGEGSLSQPTDNRTEQNPTDNSTHKSDSENRDFRSYAPVGQEQPTGDAFFGGEGDRN